MILKLERMLVDITGTGKTVRSCCKRRLEKITLPKTLKYSNCRESIQNQIPPSCRKISRARFVFVWLPESKGIQRFKRIFRLHSKCLSKELPPLSKLYVKQNKFCRPWKGLGTSLAPQSNAVLASSGFLCSKVV